VHAARRVRVPDDLSLLMLTRVGARVGAGSAGASAHLTDAQQQAVARRSESLLLAAGAGSGKTSVLVERFARAVIDDGVPPGRILAITFTERAAAELRERVTARLLAAGERGAARGLERAFVGTFHGYCARLVRAHAALAGVSPDFAILEERIAGWLRARAFALALRELIATERADAVELIAAYGAERAREITLDAYATLRSRGERYPRLPTARLACGQAVQVPLDAAAACVLFDELLERFGGAYEDRKHRRGALDFDDLELIARELLERHGDVRAAKSASFDLLMVDEFQDCNARELAIVEALERDNLFTVGDEQQAIYGFRHADVRLFATRRAALEEVCASLRLSENFRSRSEILEFVNTLFAARLGESFEQLVASREDRQLQGEPRVELLLTTKRGWDGAGSSAKSGTGSSAPAQLAAMRTGRAWRLAEARALADRVHELVDGGEARAGEVAVLLRALGDCETYEAALRERGLRTVAPAGSFWAREQVCDLVSYLRALANPLDDLALYSTLASPSAGVSRGALASLARAAHARAHSAWEELKRPSDELLAQLRGEDREVLSAFVDRFADERTRARSRSISRVLERAMHASGYREYVLAQPDGARRLANVHKLLSIAREFERREGRDLRAFLDYVSSLAEGGGAPEAEARIAADGEDAVTLLSIHSAKGLEFPVVCVADLGRAQNVSVPDLLVDGERVGLRFMSLDGDAAARALDFDALAAERRREQAREEDRILYVAMTRARDRLLLSGAIDLERQQRPREDEPPIAWLVRAMDPERSEIGRRALVRWSVNEPASFEALALDGLARGDASGADVRATPTPISVRQAGVRDTPPQPAIHATEIAALSYTALAELERCSYRYYLERTLGLGERRADGAGAAFARPSQDAVGASSSDDAARAHTRAPARTRARAGARARGMLVHKLLDTGAGKAAHKLLEKGADEQAYKLFDTGADEQAQKLFETGADERARSDAGLHAEIARAAKQLGLTITRAEAAEVARLVRRARAPEGLFARLEAADSVRREHEFAFVVGAQERLMTGVMDVLAYERGGSALIVDYKTDEAPEGRDLEEVVEREYSLQRLIYALALLRGGAAKVEVVHWFLEREDGCVTARFQAADRERLEERVSERVERALARGFVPSEHPHRGLCATCPGRAGLCSWGERETMREHAPAEPQVGAECRTESGVRGE
jgi:ATP-dependent helicase/nuclease subunit A